MNGLVFPMTEVIYTLSAAFIYWKLFARNKSMRAAYDAELSRYEQVKRALPFQTQPTVVKI